MTTHLLTPESAKSAQYGDYNYIEAATSMSIGLRKVLPDSRKVTSVVVCSRRFISSSDLIRDKKPESLQCNRNQRAASLDSEEVQSSSKHPCELSDELVEKRYGDIAHTTLTIDKLKHSRFLTEDVFSVHPCQLMRASLNKHLPNSTSVHSVEADWLHLGHQQIFFRPRLTARQLLPDGTDTRFLPGNGSIWQYRLWAGGSAIYNLDQPYNLAKQAKAFQLEVVEDIRVLGNYRPEKVFVKVRRLITENDGWMEGLSRKKLIQHLSQLEKPPLEEQYTLCFLRDPPGDSTERKGISPPKDPLFSHEMVPHSNLLFQFSALTYNAHKIHFSSTFARHKYGMKHIVVHGPFTQLLITEFLRYALSTRDIMCRREATFIKALHYTNLKPLYADEPMTLCCRPLMLEPNQDPWQAEAWRVWIETGQEGNASLAVRAVVILGTTPTAP